MSERSPLTSAMKGRRDPSARHSMYVFRQDGPELSFADAVKNHDALLTSIYGSRSVDQRLTTSATPKADVSSLGNAGQPRSTVSFPPVTKSTTSSVWQPLFHHTTLVGSAAPLLATFKRDTHVQTEDEIRSDVGVQTEEEEIQPTATYKRDVLVQTGEVWADLEPGGSDVSTARHLEITPSRAGDACSTHFYPEEDAGLKKIDEKNYSNQKPTAGPLFRVVTVEEALQSLGVQVDTQNSEYYDPLVLNETNIKSEKLSPKSIVQNSSQILIEKRPQICCDISKKDYVSGRPVCKSEISFVPHRPACSFEGAISVDSEGDSQNVDFPLLESDEPQECPSTKFFTTYEVINLKGPRIPDSRPVECENSPKPSRSHQNNLASVISRTLAPDKANRNSSNMDDYKYGHLSSCNTSERGSMVSVLDSFYADSFKFESCENLDQLEEEIIRSLCTPVKELEENSRSVIEENSVPNSLDHAGGVPSSPRFFYNMSDQQKTEWRPGDKLSPRHTNCDIQSNDEGRSPNYSVRAGTPTKIDKKGMEARGEIIEKLMKGEIIGPKNFDLNSESSGKETLRCRSEDKEITVELLPAQLIASTPVILEVRRSSWSATNNTGHAQKTNENTSRNEYNKMDNSMCESPVTYRENLDKKDEEIPYFRSSSAPYQQDEDITGNSSPKNVERVSSKSPSAKHRPTYWPSQKSNESDPVVKTEIHLNLTPSNNPSTQCDTSPHAEMNTTEKVKSAPPTPPPEVPPLPPPPPPPPPPPQGYRHSPKSSEISFDNSAKAHNSSSCPPHAKNSSPSSFTSSPKDLMMQELAERFQKRQRSVINNSCVAGPEDEVINREGNYLPSHYNKENTNVSSSYDPYAQKESSPGSNAPNPSFKSVWSSTNGENYIDHNGKDATHSSPDKNGTLYNSHSPQEALSGPDVRQHQIGNHTSSFPYAGQYSETHSYPNKDDTKYPSSFSGTTILSNEPPPAGAILVDQKVTVEGDHVHTDKYYAVPVKEVLKEKTSTAKFTPAPPKYEGIGPTEEGVPTGLRQSVKKENMSNWYKTMFKSLHKAGHPHYGGYNSDPEFEREETAIITKCATLDTRQKPSDSSRQPINRLQHGYPPSAKSTVEVYSNVHPRPIEDYEPGYSSVVDNEDITLYKRFLPPLNHPKPAYEFKSGYESDTSIIKKLHQPEGPHPEQQKMWYREIQQGGDIPQYGLGKPAPEKPKVPVIGPAPTPSLQSSPVKPTYPQAVRPRTPPPEFVTNDSNSTDVSNGNYSAQMQHAIHAELQRRMSPGAQQSPVPYRASPKSPSKSPDLKMFARVLYDFISESPRELNLKKEELVLVLRQLDKNWYEGEHKGAIGIFPVSYVEILPPEHVSPQVKQPLEGLAKAVYDFRAQTSVELPLKKGDTVSLIRRVDQNWYEGRMHDRKGIFPASYVQVVQEPGESRRSSVSSTSRAADSPHSLKAQEDSVKKSPVVCPTPPPATYSSSHMGTTFSNSPSAYARGKKGSSLVEPVLYRALYGYSPQNADELELSEGDNVYVVEMCDDGWFVGTSVRTGVFGIFPGNYVEKV